MASLYALAACEYEPSASRRFASCTISWTDLADDSPRAELDSESSRIGRVRIGGTRMLRRVSCYSGKYAIQCVVYYLLCATLSYSTWKLIHLSQRNLVSPPPLKQATCNSPTLGFPLISLWSVTQVSILTLRRITLSPK